MEQKLHRRTLEYLRRKNSGEQSENVIVIDDASLAERFQNQYFQLLELETQQGRKLNKDLLFKFLSEEELSTKRPKKASKKLRFLRIFRCSINKTTPTPNNETCLVECQCCYDETPISESTMCESDHIFCHPCVIKGTDLAISNSQSYVRCFADCNDEISLPTLQSVLPPKTYEILMKKRQEEEVAAARLDSLETCPYCPYQMELDVDVVTFYCQNPECMKITCRSCKKIYHYDIKCEDVVDEHKGRLFVEEEMSEALIRKCYNCKKPFVLWDGCNKIQCSCGAIMCYRCRQPITGYSHFDGTGGCQLHEDTETLDKIQIEQRRVKAISELLRDFPGLKIPQI